MQAYTALDWIANAETEHVSRGSLEVSLEKLSVHDMLNSSGQQHSGTGATGVERGSLLHFYLKSEGSSLLSSFMDFEGVLSKGHIPAATAVIANVLWVIAF